MKKIIGEKLYDTEKSFFIKGFIYGGINDYADAYFCDYDYDYSLYRTKNNRYFITDKHSILYQIKDEDLITLASQDIEVYREIFGEIEEA